MDCIHLLGVILSDGRRFRLFGDVSERDFERCRNVPAGWIFWHVPNQELREGSSRVEEIKTVAVLDRPTILKAVDAIEQGITADAFFASLHRFDQPHEYFATYS